ncbi:choice-of-anchor D domain-containing protein [Roseateles sp. SL47]|uniref:choice-of-anchor D domain-containing protein n=1 Tax=Roseateles sp. SL47 TaxID=2995138 RepID=UPI00226F89D9|nr:Loki-CTERM sorting domain-containing protein [Roseateles sp. SL47]WAC71636.1 choice-of-anchor D domain-containing protein [Roseateles sp. SL47]
MTPHFLRLPAAAETPARLTARHPGAIARAITAFAIKATTGFGALAAIMAFTAPTAWAADPVAGQTKFSQNCASCHTVASTASVDRGRNNPAMIQNAINNVGAMNSALSGRLTATDLADIAAWLGNSPSSLSFAQTSVGQSSAVSTVTVSASRTAALGSLAATISGDFVVQGGTCGTTLAASTSCTVGVLFRPTTSGARTGTLSISHDGISTPVQIALAGTGTAATAQAGLSADSSALDFGTQTVGATSTARTATLTNTGNAALNFSAITVGGTNATDFTQGGTCAVGTPLAVGATCTVRATFTPAAAGARSASVAVTGSVSSGSGSGSGTAQVSIGLSGTGQAAATPVARLSSTALAFGAATVGGTSQAQAITVTNTGTASLVVSSATTTGPFAVTQDCGAGVAAGGTCTLSVTFSPTATGAAAGSLSLASNGTGSPQAVALGGMGVVGNVAVLTWSGSTQADFGTVPVGADAALKHFTLTNTGTAAATLGSFALADAAAADFRIDTSTTCTAGASLAVGATCDVAVGFSPRATGSRVATLAVVADNAGLPLPLSLSGTGQGAAQPGLQLSATSFTLSGTGTAGQALTLTNTGAGVLHISAVTLSGGQFVVDGSGTSGCGTAPFTLQPGANCRLTLRWQGSTAETATLTLQGDMTPATATVSLNGTPDGTAPANRGGGGCSIGAGTGAADPLLLVMAGIAAVILWRRRPR